MSEGIAMRRVLLLTSLFILEAVAFGLLGMLNNTESILAHDDRTIIPTLMLLLLIGTALSALAVAIVTFYVLKRGSSNSPMTEAIGGAFCAASFITWMVPLAMLTAKGPGRYYCGTGKIANKYCQVVINSIEGLTWAGDGIILILMIDCLYVAWAMKKGRI